MDYTLVYTCRLLELYSTEYEYSNQYRLTISTESTYIIQVLTTSTFFARQFWEGNKYSVHTGVMDQNSTSSLRRTAYNASRDCTIDCTVQVPVQYKYSSTSTVHHGVQYEYVLVILSNINGIL